MDLKQLRNRIDGIDAQLIDLLNNRMELALQTRKLKKETTDPVREGEVLKAVGKRSQRLVDPKFSEKVFKEIITESKRLQDNTQKLAGFQGEHGAYSEMAIRNYDEKLIPIPCNTFEEVFEGVESGQLDLGIVPVENSLGGSVDQVNDLLIETNLKIIGEIDLPIHHCLLATPQTDYRDIKSVYSHPQALSQCRGFISRNKLEARQYYDTAGAARMVAKEQPKGGAAIGSRLCAEIYDLEVLKENIEDLGSNTTRFVVISKTPIESGQIGNKCSLAFSTLHKPGALFGVIKLFYEAKVNLTRIESRPIPKDPGKFAFLVDFEGSTSDQKVSELLIKVKEETAMLKLLGCYKVKA
ncbi:prephenate dehydratase [Candidatus Micrarchaeota archaeon]|nr:prephenate dehydratase [Candidatus Micrarchaeota archaeon]